MLATNNNIMNLEITISFIIPCKNEKDTIGACLDSIMHAGMKSTFFEIIVVDNGSTDGTINKILAYSDQVKLHVLEEVSISQLRNHGARIARFNWLAFIDADVELLDGWFGGFQSVIKRVKQTGGGVDNLAVGATYLNPPKATWVQRAWYLQLMARDEDHNSYINGGNLIVHRCLFENTGGFDTHYQTGEDVRFCENAASKGGRIIKDKSICAAHHGYPSPTFALFSS